MGGLEQSIEGVHVWLNQWRDNFKINQFCGLFANTSVQHGNGSKAMLIKCRSGSTHGGPDEDKEEEEGGHDPVVGWHIDYE